MIEKPSVSIDFRPTGNFRLCQSSGWWTPETHGVWSDAPEAKIIVAGLVAGVAHRADILATPFVWPPTVIGQALAIHSGGQELFSGRLAGPGRISFTIPALAVSEVGVAELNFRFPDAVAPRDVGASGDSRQLGFSLLRADFFPNNNGTARGSNDLPLPIAQLAADGDATRELKTPIEGPMRPTHNGLHKLWAELDREVDRVVAGSGAGYPFMRKLIDHLGYHDHVVAEFARAASRSCGESIRSCHRNPLTIVPMPRFTHRIWLTADDVPALPPEDFIGPLLRANLRLPADATHFFWSNSAAVREHVQRRAKEIKCHNLVTMDISLFQSEPSFPTITRLAADRKFVQASDVLRFLIVHRFGGIYADLGGLFDAATFDLASTCDYALTGSAADFFQASLIASVPQSDLTGIFLAVFDKPHALSSAYALLGGAIAAMDELHIYGALGFTACALLFLPPWARTVILPMQSPHMQFRAQHSWYGAEPKHGNVLVERTSPSFLTNTQFHDADASVSHGLQFFGHDPILQEKLRILLLTAPYFDSHPTRFCEVFAHHGINRSPGRQSYGFLYNYILGAERGRTRRILEIEAKCSGGLSAADGNAMPGASLRAWREAFPLATVIGGIGDERQLFRDERIETYFVDRTRPETLETLLCQLGDAPLDLVLDDGLLTFEANVNVYRAAWPLISPDGFLVIEDVRNEDALRWAELLATTGVVGAIVKLPRPQNHADTNLVLILGQARR